MSEPSRPKQIVLHVGFWKCGSTSLQDTLLAHAGLLATHGIIYPDVPPLRQRLIVDAFHSAPHILFWNRNARRTGAAEFAERRDLGLKFLDRHLHLARDKTLLLSSEHYITLPQADLTALRDHLDARTDQVRVVVYARHPVALARSGVQEKIKQGVTTLEVEMGRPSAYPLRGSLEKLVRVFGRHRVHLRPLDRAILHQGSTAQDFLHIAAPDLDLGNEIQDRYANPSLSMEGLLIADALAQIAPALNADGSRNAERGPRDYLHSIVGNPVMFDQAWEDAVDRLGRADVAYVHDEWGVDLQRPDRQTSGQLWGDNCVKSLAHALNSLSGSATDTCIPPPVQSPLQSALGGPRSER